MAFVDPKEFSNVKTETLCSLINAVRDSLEFWNDRLHEYGDDFKKAVARYEEIHAAMLAELKGRNEG